MGGEVETAADEVGGRRRRKRPPTKSAGVEDAGCPTGDVQVYRLISNRSISETACDIMLETDEEDDYGSKYGRGYNYVNRDGAADEVGGGGEDETNDERRGESAGGMPHVIEVIP